MIAVLLFFAQAAPVAVPVILQNPVIAHNDVQMPPSNWSTLPVLHYRTAPDTSADLSSFVRSEVKAGRCAHATPAVHGWTLKIDLAVFGTADGQARRIVPRAIDCPTVEQYASGLVSRMARNNIDTTGGSAGWYRTSMAFAWNE